MPIPRQQPLLIVGDNVVAAVGERLPVVNRKSGVRLHSVSLPGGVMEMTGPPVVMRVSTSTTRDEELLAVDVARMAVVPLRGRMAV